MLSSMDRTSSVTRSGVVVALGDRVVVPRQHVPGVHDHEVALRLLGHREGGTEQVLGVPRRLEADHDAAEAAGRGLARAAR